MTFGTKCFTEKATPLPKRTCHGIYRAILDQAMTLPLSVAKIITLQQEQVGKMILYIFKQKLQIRKLKQETTVCPSSSTQNVVIAREKIHPIFQQFVAPYDNDLRTLLYKFSKPSPEIAQRFGLFVADNVPLAVRAGRASPDLTNEFKGAATKFMLKYFLDTEPKIGKILSSLVDLIEAAVRQFIADITPVLTGILPPGRNLRDLNECIHFIFKGGAVLRAIFMKYKQSIPSEAAENLWTAYNDVFKRSDLDFEFLVAPDLSDSPDPALNKRLYSRITKGLEELSFGVLNRLRNNFAHELPEWFSFYSLNNTWKENLLREALGELNQAAVIQPAVAPDTHAAKEARLIQRFGAPGQFLYGLRFVDVFWYDVHSNRDEYERAMASSQFVDYPPSTTLRTNLSQERFGRPDIFIAVPTDTTLPDGNMILKIKTDADAGMLARIYPENTERMSEFFISWNDAIKFQAAGNNVDFKLLRLKLNLTAVASTQDGKYIFLQIPGEIIDISIATKNDYKPPFRRGLRPEEFIERYRYTPHDNSKNIPAFDFWSYTIDKFAFDLELILFVENEFPWSEPKYSTRIKRYMFLFLLQISREPQNRLQEISDALSALENAIYDPANDRPRPFATIRRDSITGISVNNLPESNCLRVLVEKLIVIYDRVQGDLTKVPNFEDLSKNIRDNIIICRQFLRDMTKANNYSRIVQSNIGDNFKDINFIGGEPKTNK